MERKCPLCKKLYSEVPALSRRDNKTKICPNCGTMEALAVFMESEYTGTKKPDEENPKYCIFERRICEHANKEGKVFNCKAPSDELMTCRK
jgi:protein-disulfide isomerase